MILRNIRNSAAVALAGVVFFCLAGCEPAPKPWAPKVGTVEFRVTQIADGAVAKTYPNYDRQKFPMRLTQEGNNWIFDYQLPENMVGGTPTVVIDKRTLSIVKIYESQ